MFVTAIAYVSVNSMAQMLVVVYLGSVVMCVPVCCQFPLLDKSHGVRILCVCPGITDTPIAAGVFDAYEKLDFDLRQNTKHVTMQQ
jgi:hypothetical protein